jgi:hypothetical protein
MFEGRFGVSQTGAEYGICGFFHQIKECKRIGIKDSILAACRAMRRLEAFLLSGSFHIFKIKISIGDPRCLSPIRIFSIPDPRIQGQKDSRILGPHPHQRI